MQSCRICGQTIEPEEFDRDSDICSDCIIRSSKNLGVKTISLLYFFAIDAVYFVSVLINIFFIVFNSPHLFGTLVYFIPASVISGGLLVGYILVSRIRASKRYQEAL